MGGSTNNNALGQIKLKYNKILKRQGRAEEWVNANVPEMKSREYMEYLKILIQLNNLITEAKKNGYEMTYEEIVGGFKT